MGTRNTKIAPGFSEVKEKTHLANEELQKIYDLFIKKYSNGEMTKDEFINENLRLNGGSEQFWEEMFHQFESKKTGRINVKDFILNYALITNGTPEEKLTWAFKMFDTENRGYLETKELTELILYLFSCEKVRRDAPEEKTLRLKKSRKGNFRRAINISEAANALLLEMDRNRDGKIELDEFIYACTHNSSIVKVFESALERVIEIRTLAGDVEAFGNQVAGHKKEGKSIMKQGDKIYKPFSLREFEFYEYLKTWDNPPRFFPKYFGRTQIPGEGDTVNHYIVLEDFTYGMKRPCICDLKMGPQTFESDASLIKRVQMGAFDKMSTSSNLGFRMCGMRVWNRAKQEYIVKDKLWCGLLGSNGIKDAFCLFVTNGIHTCYEILSAFLPHLREILAWFENQHYSRFVGSSILLLYDGEDFPPRHRPLLKVNNDTTTHTSESSRSRSKRRASEPPLRHVDESSVIPAQASTQINTSRASADNSNSTRNNNNNEILNDGKDLSANVHYRRDNVNNNPSYQRSQKANDKPEGVQMLPHVSSSNNSNCDMEQRTQGTTNSTSIRTNSSNEKYKKYKNGVTEKGNDETSKMKKNVVPPLSFDSQSRPTVTPATDSKNQNSSVWRPTKVNFIPFSTSSSQQYSGHEEISTPSDKINTPLKNSSPSSETVTVSSNSNTNSDTKESATSSEENILKLSSHRSQKKVRFVPQIRVGLVDFAHTSKIEDGGIDDDYIYGLKTLINVLEEIEREHCNDPNPEEELWITELRRSRRSVLVCIENRTSMTLTLVDNVLIGEHQVWAALPQKEIPPYSAIQFGTNGTNLFSGTNACVCYKCKGDSNDEEREYRFVVRWENSAGLFSRRAFEGFIAPESPNLRVDMTERAGRVLYHLGGDCTEVTFTLSEVKTSDSSSTSKSTHI